jgi:hypothetical protein
MFMAWDLAPCLCHLAPCLCHLAPTNSAFCGKAVDLGVMVHGLGFRVWGSGLRVSGLVGFGRVWYTFVLGAEHKSGHGFGRVWIVDRWPEGETPCPVQGLGFRV